MKSIKKNCIFENDRSQQDTDDEKVGKIENSTGWERQRNSEETLIILTFL